jgi:hypothetical protein
MSGTATARALIKVKIKDPLADLLSSVTQTVTAMEAYPEISKMREMQSDLRILARICKGVIDGRSTRC